MRSEEFLHQLMDVRLSFSTFGLRMIDFASHRGRVIICWWIWVRRFIKLPICFVIVGSLWIALVDFVG